MRYPRGLRPLPHSPPVRFAASPIAITDSLRLTSSQLACRRAHRLQTPPAFASRRCPNRGGPNTTLPCPPTQHKPEIPPRDEKTCPSMRNQSVSSPRGSNPPSPQSSQIIKTLIFQRFQKQPPHSPTANLAPRREITRFPYRGTSKPAPRRNGGTKPHQGARKETKDRHSQCTCPYMRRTLGVWLQQRRARTAASRCG